MFYNHPFNVMIVICLVLIIGVLVFLLLKKHFYYQLFLNATDGISLLKNNKIIACNDALVELFGYKNKKTFLSIHPLKLSPPYQPDGTFSIKKAEEMFDMAKQSGNVTFDWVFVDSDGNEKWIEINIIKIEQFFKFQSDIFCMIWKNINKRKKIEEDLRELNIHLETLVGRKTKELNEKEHMLFFQSKQAQMGEMISMIAHQWRQPLASIAVTAIGLKMKLHFQSSNSLPNSPFNKELISYFEEQLGDIEKYTQTLTTTIDDFRNFYKPQSTKERTSLNKTILQSYNIIKRTLKSSDIEVAFTLDSVQELEHFQGEIIQVFLNLFNNALENFDEKKIRDRRISITSKDFEGGVRITFCDSGGGIAPQYLDKIFSPYFTTKTNGLGTGLGLYMSKKILQEHHNGEIKIENSDIGVCFVIEIR